MAESYCSGLQLDQYCRITVCICSRVLLPSFTCSWWHLYPYQLKTSLISEHVVQTRSTNMKMVPLQPEGYGKDMWLPRLFILMQMWGGLAGSKRKGGWGTRGNAIEGFLCEARRKSQMFSGLKTKTAWVQHRPRWPPFNGCTFCPHKSTEGFSRIFPSSSEITLPRTSAIMSPVQMKPLVLLLVTLPVKEKWRPLRAPGPAPRPL